MTRKYMIAGHRNFIEDLWDQVHLRNFGNLAISSTFTSLVMRYLAFNSFGLFSSEKQFPRSDESLQFVCGRSFVSQEESFAHI